MRIDDKQQYGHTREQLAAMLEKMGQTSNAFYRAATAIGNHAFIEFCGLMNEYIKACREAVESGIDFTECNTHTGQALPIQPYHARYIGEKLGCIYGPSLVADERLRRLLLEAMSIEGAPMKGLFHKYHVERADGKPLKGGGAIVLELGDWRAWKALELYAATVEEQGNATFAADLRRSLQEASGDARAQREAEYNAHAAACEVCQHGERCTQGRELDLVV